ncbi:hypothetical protein BDZ85DRAFT_278776 [Elsinoe ampelina]|uniref:Uncharacterized protein n=1 Tax=Elsinoe ampelina TaxID=302913 RepID=A0A6A6GMR5_9PEZI|nr:hypothetical protein BDZ85DRAFT_278776 [Elsinoe ampelina]
MRIALMVPIGAAIGQQKWLWFRRGGPGRGRTKRPMIDLERIDRASRGPWGSLLLLFKLYRPSLATLGALLTIISIGLATLTQLTVTTTLAPAFSALPAPAHSEIFDLVMLAGTASTSPRESIRGLDFSNTFDQIFHIEEDVEHSTPQCPSGNCDWPEFSTLAMCGSFVDKSNSLRRTCNYFTSTYQATHNISWCVDHVDDPERQSSEPNLGGLPEPLTWVNASDTYGHIGGDILQTPIFRLQEAPWSRQVAQSLVTLEIQDSTDRVRKAPFLFSCTLSPCIQTLRLAVVDGNVKSQVVDETLSWNLTSISADRFTTPPKPDGSTTKWYFGRVRSFGDVLQLGGEATAGPRPPYTIDQMDFDSPRAARMYRTSDLDRWIRNAAISLTNFIRANGNATDFGTSYQGMARSVEQRYQIRRRWLVFPISVAFLSTVLLIATIIVTYTSGVEHWKNDALPLLYTTIEPDVLKRSRRPEDLAKEKLIWVRSKAASTYIRAS